MRARRSARVTLRAPALAGERAEPALMERRTALVLGLLAVGSFVFAVLATIFAPESGDALSAQADPFSRSAIGQHAFVQVLRRQGVPVTISRHDSARRAGRSATLVLMGPRIQGRDSQSLAPRVTGMLAGAGTVLVVLPKWTGHPQAQHAGHLERAVPVPMAEPERLLSVAGAAVELLRSGSGRQRCGEHDIELTTAQLLKPLSDTFTPLIQCRDGVLLGAIAVPNGPRILILADPDVFSNHGLPRADNLEIALDVVAQARPTGQALVVDVATLGFEQVPSLWRVMFAFPAILAVIQAVLVVLVCGWAASVSLGQPLDAIEGRDAGKATLIETTVALLTRGNHGAYLLARYGDDVFEQAARAVHVQAGLAKEALPAALRRLLAHRTREDPTLLADVLARATSTPGTHPAALLAIARRVHRLRQDVLQRGE